jgi:hypothetical protein
MYKLEKIPGKNDFQVSIPEAELWSLTEVLEVMLMSAVRTSRESKATFLVLSMKGMMIEESNVIEFKSRPVLTEDQTGLN